MVVEYLNKLSRTFYKKYGFNSPEYIEFKKFYDEVADLLKYKSDIEMIKQESKRPWEDENTN